MKKSITKEDSISYLIIIRKESKLNIEGIGN